ncbi:MAG: nucleotidyltransferase family protein [Bacteroidales bacterium]|nr:nucleotidyltransferase family protein [Bacteroidales bacterium]
MKTAQQQTTTGLVCHAMLKHDKELNLSYDIKTQIRYQLFKVASKHKRTNAVIATLVSALRKKGIESVLLKGQGLANNYPTAELRQCGDIDLYVGENNYDAACAIVNTLAGRNEVSNSLETDLHYHIICNGVIVEIHRLTATFQDQNINATYQYYSDDGMSVGKNTIILNGVTVYLPDDTFNAFFVFSHALHHFISYGIGMRQLCDWVMLLHAKHDSINRDKLFEMLHCLNLLDAWQVFGSIAVNWLGLPMAEMPFYNAKCNNRAKRTINIILKEGNFGKEWNMSKKHRTQTGTKRRMTMFFCIQIRMWRMLWVFPKIALKQYYKKTSEGFTKMLRSYEN